MKDAVTCVGVVATDLAKVQPYLLNSMRAKLYPNDFRHNAELKLIARATAAAPTYFCAVEIKDPKGEENVGDKSVPYLSIEEPEYLRDSIVFEDGCTTANNPARLAMKYAKAYLKTVGEDFKEYQYQIVSIGTGTPSGGHDDPSERHKNWGKPNGTHAFTIRRLLVHDVFSMGMRAYEVHCKLQSKLGEKESPEAHYHRIQFKMGKHQRKHMDDRSKKNTKSIIEAADRYIYSDERKEAYSPHFQGVIDCLKREDVIRPPKIHYADLEMVRPESRPTNKEEKESDFKLLMEKTLEKGPQVLEDIGSQ